MRELILPVMALAACVMAASSHAEVPSARDPRVAELVQAGKLRVGLFPPQLTKDAATGGPHGSVWMETARELAARIGVELVVVEHATPPQAVACLKSRACDLVFLPLDARAAEIGFFSAPFIELDFTYLVPGASPFRSVAEIDRPGVRIAAVRNHASTIALRGLVKQATIVDADTPDQTFELMRRGDADVMASTRNALLAYAAALPGSRVIEDRYGVNRSRMVVPKGSAGWSAYVTEFAEEAKASGWLRRAIERAGPPGVQAAPAGDPTSPR